MPKRHCARSRTGAVTLDDLRLMKGVLAIRRLANAAGMEPEALRQRLRRGVPELTDEESTALTKALAEHKLSYSCATPPP